MMSIITNYLFSITTSWLVTYGLGAAAVASFVLMVMSVRYRYAGGLSLLACLFFIGFNSGYQLANSNYENQLLKAELAFKNHQILVHQKVAEAAQEEMKKLSAK